MRAHGLNNNESQSYRERRVKFIYLFILFVQYFKRCTLLAKQPFYQVVLYNIKHKTTTWYTNIHGLIDTTDARKTRGTYTNVVKNLRHFLKPTVNSLKRPIKLLKEIHSFITLLALLKNFEYTSYHLLVNCFLSEPSSSLPYPPSCD